MVILIILIALIALGIYLIKTDDGFIGGWKEGTGVVLCIIFGACLLVHILLWSTASIRYECSIRGREALANALEDARINHTIETAAITMSVAKFNMELANEKYYNTLWLMDSYVDDRILDIQPIK